MVEKSLITGATGDVGREVAEIFSDVLDRKIASSRPSPLSYTCHMWQRGYTLGFIGASTRIYLTTRFGFAETIRPDAAELLDREPIQTQQFARDYLPR